MSNPIAQVVERQMRNWELARSQRVEAPGPKRDEVEDFICVSRRVGTPDALAVASGLGKALDWPVFDKEILEAMGGDDFYRKQIYANMDQRDLSWLEELLRSFFDGKFVRNDYFHRLCDTLVSLARQAPAVFLGRGADLVLPPDRGLRVRLIASHQVRVDSVVAEKGLSANAATQEIARREQARLEFLQRHFRLDPATSARFDLSIHLEKFTVEQAVELILKARTLRLTAISEAATAI